MGREKPHILLKDKHNKLLTIFKQLACIVSVNYTRTQDDDKMSHINEVYEDMEDDIIFSCNYIRCKIPNINSSGPAGKPNLLLKKLSEKLHRPLSILF